MRFIDNMKRRFGFGILENNNKDSDGFIPIGSAKDGNLPYVNIENIYKGWIYVGLDKIATEASNIEYFVRNGNREIRNGEIYEKFFNDPEENFNTKMYLMISLFDLYGKFYLYEHEEAYKVASPSNVIMTGDGIQVSIIGENYSTIIKPTSHMKIERPSPFGSSLGLVDKIKEWGEVMAKIDSFNRKALIDGVVGLIVLKTSDIQNKTAEEIQNMNETIQRAIRDNEDIFKVISLPKNIDVENLNNKGTRESTHRHNL